jgi:hypothetical protein
MHDEHWWTLRVEGEDIRASADHPFWVQDRGWQAVCELEPGDRLATAAGAWARLEAAQPDDGLRP